jgi:hypothetical protein
MESKGDVSDELAKLSVNADESMLDTLKAFKIFISRDVAVPVAAMNALLLVIKVRILYRQLFKQFHLTLRFRLYPP